MAKAHEQGEYCDEPIGQIIVHRLHKAVFGDYQVNSVAQLPAFLGAQLHNLERTAKERVEQVVFDLKNPK